MLTKYSACGAGGFGQSVKMSAHIRVCIRKQRFADDFLSENTKRISVFAFTKCANYAIIISDSVHAAVVGFSRFLHVGNASPAAAMTSDPESII